MEKDKRQLKRKRRIRSKVFGSGERPRLSVFRSKRYIYAQLIDDTVGKTIASVGPKDIERAKKTKMNKTQAAFAEGEILAEKANKLGIKLAVFDRNGYKYHGRVKALAEGARSKGLVF
jgi:large subunit ribosomal protein L18